MSAGVDVDANGDEEDGDKAEVDNGMDEDRDAACLHVPEIHHTVVSRQLEQQPWRQQHKQYNRYHHRPPVLHFSLSI